MLQHHSGIAWPSVLAIHYWPAFWTVVCLGVIQISATYYSSVLSVESLPSHVTPARRRRHRLVFASLFLLFTGLTLLLAKLNDSTQYQSELRIAAEQQKQASLQAQLEKTFDAVVASEAKLSQLRVAVEAHPPGPERSAMLADITQVQQNLSSRQTSMRSFVH